MCLQGRAGTAALLLLRLLDSGHIAAVVAINDALIAHGRTKEAAAIAGATPQHFQRYFYFLGLGLRVTIEGRFGFEL